MNEMGVVYEWMFEWMNEVRVGMWMNEWNGSGIGLNVWMNEWIKWEWVCEWMNEWMNESGSGCTNEWMKVVVGTGMNDGMNEVGLGVRMNEWSRRCYANECPDVCKVFKLLLVSVYMLYFVQTMAAIQTDILQLWMWRFFVNPLKYSEL